MPKAPNFAASLLRRSASSWETVVSRFPKPLQNEILLERDGRPEDVEELSGWQLRSQTPVSLPMRPLIEDNLGVIQRASDEAISTINEKWGLNVQPASQRYDRNPERYSQYSKMDAETASPSVRVNGEIIWGCGRFIAALMRGDQTFRVWDVVNSKTAALHRTAYGYDVSGEVTDNGPTNIHDLKLLDTQPHPQQYTEAPEGQTMAEGAKLYHGTSLFTWRRDDQKPLVLFTNPGDAKIEAESAAESDRYAYEKWAEGQPIPEDQFKPIVVMIKFGSLAGHELLPTDPIRGVSWQESIRDTKSLIVQGDLADLKPKFKLVQG